MAVVMGGAVHKGRGSRIIATAQAAAPQQGRTGGAIHATRIVDLIFSNANPE